MASLRRLNEPLLLSLRRNLLNLLIKNRKDADTIDFDSFYRLGYDAPYKFWGRKNEVFVIKKSD